MTLTEFDQANQSAPVAYFSMEVGLESAMPTYSGGLGVLAEDTLRAAADMNVNMIGITLLNRKGYFHQHLDANGNQTENPVIWEPAKFLEPLETQISIFIEGREVKIRPWRRMVTGYSGHQVPVYFLDTAVPENSPWDQKLTDYLYGGDELYRLCQEIVLGMGGIAMLRAMGCTRLKAYHMNEGHSALLILSLLEEEMGKQHVESVTRACAEGVRKVCVFTTHTPVAAAMDQFPMELAHRALGDKHTENLINAECFKDGVLNMTYLGLCFSHYINGVSMRHEEISHGMFPNYPINSITNGVNAATWTSAPFLQLYDRYVPQWRQDNLYLRYCINIAVAEIEEAHLHAKQDLLSEVNKRTGARLDNNVMTIGFARRATPYKRANLLFSDLDRLRQIVRQGGRLQIIYAGKAHPRDESGKDIIRNIFKVAEELKDYIRIIYLEEYDMDLGKYVCSGVDLWLNTPQKPVEASGTSGMKAALNGVPSFSILDGWWIEGHVEGVTGWSIGEGSELESNTSQEIASLYDKLEHVIIPLFYGKPSAYAWVMRNAIALNGSYYNSQRMLSQYVKNAYYARSATDTRQTYPAKAANNVSLTLYVHENSMNGPALAGVHVTGQDAPGNPFNQTSDYNGRVTLAGAPGAWHFSLSGSGYGTNSWSQSITNSDTKHTYLIKLSVYRQITGIDPSQPKAQAARQWLSILGGGFTLESQVTLFTGSITHVIPADQNKFINSGQINVYAVLADVGTWSAQVTNPGGYQTNIFSFEVVP